MNPGNNLPLSVPSPYMTPRGAGDTQAGDTLRLLTWKRYFKKNGPKKKNMGADHEGFDEPHTLAPTMPLSPQEGQPIMLPEHCILCPWIHRELVTHDPLQSSSPFPCWPPESAKTVWVCDRVWNWVWLCVSCIASTIKGEGWNNSVLNHLISHRQHRLHQNEANKSKIKKNILLTNLPKKHATLWDNIQLDAPKVFFKNKWPWRNLFKPFIWGWKRCVKMHTV